MLDDALVLMPGPESVGAPAFLQDLTLLLDSLFLGMLSDQDV